MYGTEAQDLLDIHVVLNIMSPKLMQKLSLTFEDTLKHIIVENGKNAECWDVLREVPVSLRGLISKM